MALFGRDEGSVRSASPAPYATKSGEAQRAQASGEPSDVQAHLGRGSHVEGKLRFDGSVRIDGRVEGEVEAKDTVVIGESATVVAQVTANTVVLKGKLTGDVSAHTRVELRAPGRLLGNIVTPSLVIEEGVVFEGHCSMADADTGGRNEKDNKVALFPADDRAGARAAAEAVK